MSLLRRRMMMNRKSEEGTEISFKVQSPLSEIEYDLKARKGMTWNEWCDSHYNYDTIEEDDKIFEILNGKVFHEDDGWVVCEEPGIYVLSTDTIIEDFIYIYD